MGNVYVYICVKEIGVHTSPCYSLWPASFASFVYLNDTQIKIMVRGRICAAFDPLYS